MTLTGSVWLEISTTTLSPGCMFSQSLLMPRRASSRAGQVTNWANSSGVGRRENFSFISSCEKLIEIYYLLYVKPCKIDLQIYLYTQAILLYRSITFKNWKNLMTFNYCQKQFQDISITTAMENVSHAYIFFT